MEHLAQAGRHLLLQLVVERHVAGADQLGDARHQRLAQAGDTLDGFGAHDLLNVALNGAERARGILVGARLEGIAAGELQQIADILQNGRHLSLIHALLPFRTRDSNTEDTELEMTNYRSVWAGVAPHPN